VTGDPRVHDYAELLVGKCLDVQPGWQVLVNGGYLARPLLEAVSAALGKRGAYPLQRLSLSGQSLNIPWLLTAPEDVLAKAPPIEN
jgi:leucyl aminopeptidase (aminopeptidase T)